MAARMLAQGVDHLWLDATGLAALRRPLPHHRRRRWLPSASTRPPTGCPIAPAAHYFSGGVVTDLDGATALPGLWAAGEVACTGVHGANRLASNSLLEGMVFGPRVVEAIERGDSGLIRPFTTGAMPLPRLCFLRSAGAPLDRWPRLWRGSPGHPVGCRCARRPPVPPSLAA